MNDLRHGLRFKTPRQANVFENWLNENCAGASKLVVEDFSIQGVDKKLAVFFEKQLDMQAYNTL